MGSTDNLIIIKGESRMKQLKKRFNTKKQAKFYMQSKGIKAEVLKIGYRQEQIGEENKI